MLNCLHAIGNIKFTLFFSPDSYINQDLETEQGEQQIGEEETTRPTQETETLSTLHDEDMYSDETEANQNGTRSRIKQPQTNQLQQTRTKLLKRRRSRLHLYLAEPTANQIKFPNTMQDTTNTGEVSESETKN